MRILRSKLSILFSIPASLFISLAWFWYHVRHVPYVKFYLTILFVGIAIWFLFLLSKFFFKFFAIKRSKSFFWTSHFYSKLDEFLYLLAALFVVFFVKIEWLSLLIVFTVFLLLFLRVYRVFSFHINAKVWQATTVIFFTLGLSIFAIMSVFQFLAYYYYIMDPNIKYYDIVLFRSLVVTALWLLLFIVANGLCEKIKNGWRNVPMIVWGILFGLNFVFWLLNVTIVYFSGLYFSPVVINHISGSWGLVINWRLSIFIVLALIGWTSIFFLIKFIVRRKKDEARHVVRYFNVVGLLFCVFCLFSISSLSNLPEYFVLKNFYDHYRGESKTVSLRPEVLAKLEKFGLKYNLNNFYLAHKDFVYKKDVNLLSSNFNINNRPNVLIFFLESFSSRLTSVYNKEKFPDLTPGLEKMAENKFTTVFHKYYNASTPTVTGLLSQLCSFLPPTGHNEIEKENYLHKHHLLCLPRVLREKAGYNYSAYVTAVRKDFANKDTIFMSMGTDEVYGTDELKSQIVGEPLSWGYSDHQTMPFLWKLLAEKAKEPFFVMHSSVDTHPPFTQAKDGLKYRDGKNVVLNSIKTTDDAFEKFWDEFVKSKYFNNTIVIAVADHAMFPGALTSDLFGDQADKIGYYDETTFMIYAPESVMPKSVDLYSSGLDFTPTILQILGINVPNSFEGHSIFDDRDQFVNLLGMHELGLNINQVVDGKRTGQFSPPANLSCSEKDYSVGSSTPLTLCDFLNYFQWKKQMFEQGRFWDW